MVKGRDPSEYVFLNRCGRPITRNGIHTLIEQSATRAVKKVPLLATKRVSPHTIRHKTATHLLRWGDINTIRAWLGHVSLTTTHIYLEIHLETKARALPICEVKGREIKGGNHGKPWKQNTRLMEFLRML